MRGIESHSLNILNDIEAMVSFRKVLAEIPITHEVPAEIKASSKKRKWEGPLTHEEFFKNNQSPIDQLNHHEKRKSIFDIEFPLETPLPSNKSQQYLTIQSGQIHFCNTRTNMKTPESKRNPEMSLDLELNLTCESLGKKEENCDTKEKKQSSFVSSPVTSFSERNLLNNINESNKYNTTDSSSSLSCGGLTRSPSWLSIDGDHKEMVATVCKKCHMLVMLCKSSPSCPNCKFMHPPDQNPSFLKRRSCSLLC